MAICKFYHGTILELKFAQIMFKNYVNLISTPTFESLEEWYKLHKNN